MEKAVLQALTKNGRITLTSLSNPRGNGEAGTSTSGKSSDAESVKGELNSLLRLLHNDRQKLAKLTNSDATIKVSNPAMLAKIKVHQLGLNIEDLPIMQTHMLTKLLTMHACEQIDYSGVGSKADAWHISHFLKFERDGVTLRAVKSMKTSIEKCFCAIALEGRNDYAFFCVIFRPTCENLYDAARITKLDDLSMDWMAYELAMVFSQWA